MVPLAVPYLGVARPLADPRRSCGREDGPSEEVPSRRSVLVGAFEGGEGGGHGEEIAVGTESNHVSDGRGLPSGGSTHGPGFAIAWGGADLWDVMEAVRDRIGWS